LRSAIITIRLLLKRARLDRALNDTLISPRQPSGITATLKRQALKKTEQLKKNAGKVDAIPAVFSFSHRD
jgi:hypothetical protein